MSRATVGGIAEPAWLDRKAYPFAHRFLELQSGLLHFLDEGQGPPVILVHGTPTWSFDFRHVVQALAPQHRCIAPDLLGFGLSARPPVFPYTPDAHAGVIAEFVDRLELDRFALVVHDFGGPIALPLALAGRVTRLVLINTWMWPLDEDAGLRRSAQLAGSVVGRWLYKYANASLRVLTPAAYGDRSKLTRAIHRQLLEPFRRREDRVLVLHALARSLLASREYYADLAQPSGSPEGDPGDGDLGHEGSGFWSGSTREMAAATPARLRGPLPKRRALAARGRTGSRRRPNQTVSELNSRSNRFAQSLRPL